MTTIDVGTSFIIDETEGVDSSPPSNDVTLSTIDTNEALFYDRLFNNTSDGGLGLQTSFTTNAGDTIDDPAASEAGFITVNPEGGTITGLSFAGAGGATLTAWDPAGGSVPTSGEDSGMQTTSGDEIYLFTDLASGLGDHMVLGIDASGNVAFAIYMLPTIDPATGDTSITLSVVQFEAIHNDSQPDTPDDVTSLTDKLTINVSSTESFDIASLPSGNSLYATIGTADGLIVTSNDPASLTVNTSQGGGPTTIGIQNQMFDNGEGAFFTFVTDNTSPTLSKDGSQIAYGGLLEVDGGSFTISQTQGNLTKDPVVVELRAYDYSDSQGSQFITDITNGALGGTVGISAGDIIVKDGAGNDVTSSMVITQSGSYVDISGLQAGYTVFWTTSANHDRLEVLNVGQGKFDIGGFSINQPTAASAPINSISFRDDGPKITLSGAAEPTLTTHETDLVSASSSSSGAVAFAGQFTDSFGTDGKASTTPISYFLSATDGTDAGLVASVSGDKVYLYNDTGTGDILGEEGNSGSGAVVFRVHVDPTSGDVTLTQYLAVKQGSADPYPDTNETIGLTGTGLIGLNQQITDGDGDQSSKTLDITGSLLFADAGPSISATGTIGDLQTHETNLVGESSTLATQDYSSNFTDTAGPDGLASLAYTLVATNNAATNLTDSQSGTAIHLSIQSDTEVWGVDANGDKVFTVSVDGAGVVTLTQDRAVKQGSADAYPDTHEPISLSNGGLSGLISLQAKITDNDGDYATQLIDLTPHISFTDAGPSITASGSTVPDLQTHETSLTSTDSADYATDFTPTPGPDGQASLTYALSLGNGTSTNLVDSQSDTAVSLVFVSGAEIDGVNGNGDKVFTVTLDGSTVTLTQYRAVKQGSADSPDTNEPISLDNGSLANLILLSATVTDNDGDYATQSIDLTPHISFTDAGPTITESGSTVPDLQTHETGLTSTDSADYATDFTPTPGPDGQASLTYALSLGNGTSTNLVDSQSDTAVSLVFVSGAEIDGVNGNGDKVFTVTLDGSTVTLTQYRAVKQGSADSPDTNEPISLDNGSLANLILLSATVTDNDGDYATQSIDLTPHISFTDAGPTIVASTTDEPSLTTSDANLGTGGADTQNFSGQFTPAYGPDGQAASNPLIYGLALTFAGNGTQTNIIDTQTGNHVFLFLQSGVVVGLEGTDATNALASGQQVFTVSVDATGHVTLTQDRAVYQYTPSSGDTGEGVSMTGSHLIDMTATATDGDGDYATAALDLTPLITFTDTGPTIGSGDPATIASSTVDFTSGVTGTAGPVTLNGVLGNDGGAAVPYTIVGYPTTVDVGGAVGMLSAVLSSDKSSVTYYRDTNGDGTYGNTGDTAYYRLALDETGAGSYTFQVLTDPPPAQIDFNFNELASGNNLFGTVGDQTTAMMVFGDFAAYDPTTLKIAQGSDTVNSSQGGTDATIGINNQMFTNGASGYFTFISGAEYVGSGLSPTEANNAGYMGFAGLLEANSGYLLISQTQGNKPAAMTLDAYDLKNEGFDPTTASSGGLIDASEAANRPVVNMTEIRVFDSLGNLIEDSLNNGTTGGSVVVNDPNVAVSWDGGVPTISGLTSGEKLQWSTGDTHQFDQVDVTQVSGKFDIGGAGLIQLQPTPAQDLNFTAQATDGDGDYAQASFGVHINEVAVASA